MNPLSAIMGAADLICGSLVVYTFGFVWWSMILFGVMAIKGGMSFL